MAKDYQVAVKITVTRGTQGEIINSEETAWSNLSFEQMTKASAEYFELLSKISKAVK